MRHSSSQQNNKWPHTGAVFCNVINSRVIRNTSARDIEKLELTCRLLSKVCERVVLVGNYDYLPESLHHLKHISVHLLNTGPIGCLEALLSSGIDSEYILTPCDVGVENAEIFRLLTDDHVKPPAILAYPHLSPNAIPSIPTSIDLIDQPLICKYSARFLIKIREQLIKNDFSMHRLAQLGEAERIIVPRELIYNTISDSPIVSKNFYNPN
ncbi:MAG: hypothetical protein KBD53_01965 [Candidatus Omnitrophica bacterium]|nr:hypothetical protein [Candidatus Omnitrophota bacterium]